ncbi:heme ABC transporter ATP-binding protein [Leucobacter sp.]
MPAAPVRLEPGAVALEGSGVSVSLGGRTIVSGADFSVRIGEIVAIIGPNGAGKSTLLGAIAGDHPYGGSIRLAGREISDWSNRELALRRSVLRQSNAISFPFDVVDVVKMGRAPWRGLSTVEEDDRVIAQELLRSDTFQFAERAFTSLSGGERARVSLARVMTQRASLLLLDEPTAALDINYQEQVLALARRYARQGNAVVVVLHDLAAAAAYADRVMLIADGGVRVFGAPEKVLTAELLSEVYRHPVRVLRDGDGALVVLPVRFADEDPGATSVEESGEAPGGAPGEAALGARQQGSAGNEEQE